MAQNLKLDHFKIIFFGNSFRVSLSQLESKISIGMGYVYF
ncbi:MAG: Hypothetical protein AJITA_01135 [Acetilactobacillus jinshanensis]